MHYIDKAGAEHTAEVMAMAVQYAKDAGIGHIVIASHTGATAETVTDYGGLTAVIVTSAYGYSAVNQNPMSEARRAELTAKGYKVCTAGHALSGAERSLSGKFGGVYPTEIIAHTLRMFGQGTKVCVEIATMAADAGLIPEGEPVVAVAGTGRGADTALVLCPATTQRILDTQIQRYICKPIAVSKPKK